jgi:hypothetical protein
MSQFMPRGPGSDPSIERPGSRSEANTGFGKINIANEGKFSSNFSKREFFYEYFLIGMGQRYILFYAA